MLSLLLHLYQPPYQRESILKHIYEQSYYPLLKFLKQHKDVKVTLNLPFSFLELLYKFGYSEWLSEIKILYKNGQVELVGSGAYHPLLSRLPQELITEQILLNEAGIGYFFGKHSNFEGETALMFNTLAGFFPPELAVSTSVISVLESLNYSYVIVDSGALHGSEAELEVHNPKAVYSLKGHNIKVVVRNTVLSNQIAFCRSYSADSIDLVPNPGVVALDGETFGHHNKDGIALLENIVENYHAKGVKTVSLSDLTHLYRPFTLSKICESSWGASLADVSNCIPLPIWENENNELQVKLWSIYNKCIKLSINTGLTSNTDCLYLSLVEYMLSPQDKRNNITNSNIFGLLEKKSKFISSDMFWWASNFHLETGQLLYDKKMIQGALNAYKDFLAVYVQETSESDKTSEILHDIADITQKYLK